MGSPPFGTFVLDALLESAHEVVGVVTPPDRPKGRGRKTEPSEISAKAKAMGSTQLIQPKTTRDDHFKAQLRQLQPGALMVASYGEILDQEVLDMASHGALNVHASLLPRWRGAAPIQYALLSGDDETGVCVQRMVLALDAGPIVTSTPTRIQPDESAESLLERLGLLGGQAACTALDLIESGSAVFTPQDEGAVSLAPKIRKEHGLADWTLCAQDLERQLRAFTPWPGLYTFLPESRRLAIKAARIAETMPAQLASASPGACLQFEGRLFVRAGNRTCLELLRVQLAGKAPMEACAFLRGSPLPPLTQLSNI